MYFLNWEVNVFMNNLKKRALALGMAAMMLSSAGCTNNNNNENTRIVGLYETLREHGKGTHTLYSRLCLNWPCLKLLP